MKRKRGVDTAEEWDDVIRAASRVQRILPDAILVGGSASAIHCKHRFSYDDDHVIANLAPRFKSVLEQLEEVAGWRTNRLRPPVLILGNFDGVETGIRNLIRSEPLDTTVYESAHGDVTLPTLPEMMRIKAALILKRNTTRDFIDFVALADHLRSLDGDPAVADGLASLDRLYPQENGESAVRQLCKQLAQPRPYDIGDGDLSVYRIQEPRFADWSFIAASCSAIGAEVELATLRLAAKNHEATPGDFSSAPD